MLTGCQPKELKLSYYDYTGKSDYNKDLFYVNELETTGADPDVIYITEGEEAGYYYMYITSDEISGSGYLAYRSKDMVSWECTGVALSSFAEYDADSDYTTISFAFSLYWAPEVVYDATSKLYYMFYTADEYAPGAASSTHHFFADIAISDKPQGPFVQYNRYYEKELNYSPRVDSQNRLKIYEPLFDFSKMSTTDPLYEAKNDGYMKVIDVSPFIDPVSGKKYMYFCHDLGSTISVTSSSIYAIELHDDWTPDYTKVYQLTEANKLTVGGENTIQLSEGKVNEAPFVVYNPTSKLYYLFYSANTYNQKTYSVRLAVGSSPTGPFTKLTNEQGGFVLYAEGHWSWASGTGHCSVVNRDGQDFIFYHAHKNRVNGNSSRAVAMDELNWVENDDGLLIPIVNGPSYALMPKTTTEHTNLAKSAVITATNVSSDSDVKYLNDGIIPNHSAGFSKECQFNSGSATITLSFDDYKEIVALSVFNSKDYDLTFSRIEKISFEVYDEAHDFHGVYYTDPLSFDWDRYYTTDGYVIPCGSFTIEFAPIKVKTITIELNVTEAFAISEICVLEK